VVRLRRDRGREERLVRRRFAASKRETPLVPRVQISVGVVNEPRNGKQFPDRVVIDLRTELRQARQQIAEVAIRVERQQLAAGDQTHQHGGRRAAAIGSGEESVLPADRQVTQRLFRQADVDRHIVVVRIAAQRGGSMRNAPHGLVDSSATVSLVAGPVWCRRQRPLTALWYYAAPAAPAASFGKVALGRRGIGRIISIAV